MILYPREKVYLLSFEIVRIVGKDTEDLSSRIDLLPVSLESGLCLSGTEYLCVNTFPDCLLKVFLQETGSPGVGGESLGDILEEFFLSLDKLSFVPPFL